MKKAIEMLPKKPGLFVGYPNDETRAAFAKVKIDHIDTVDDDTFFLPNSYSWIWICDNIVGKTFALTSAYKSIIDYPDACIVVQEKCRTTVNNFIKHHYGIEIAYRDNGICVLKFS